MSNAYAYIEIVKTQEILYNIITKLQFRIIQNIKDHQL